MAAIAIAPNPVRAAVCEGADAVRDFVATLQDGFPDFRADLRAIRHRAGAVVYEFEMSGTHEAPWAGLNPTHKAFRLPAEVVYERDDRGEFGSKVYFDMAAMLGQLGVLG